MKVLIAIALAFALQSCSLIKGLGQVGDLAATIDAGLANAGEKLDAGMEVATKAIAAVDAKLEDFKAITAKADLNKDGKIEGAAERLAWLEQLLLYLGIGGVGGGGIVSFVRKLLKRNKNSDERKTVAENRIAGLETAHAALVAGRKLPHG